MLKLKKYNTLIPSDINCICATISGIISFLEESNGPIDECIVFELKVIFNELILNAIKHGNKCEASKTVKLTAGISKDGYVFFLVEDEGDGYDYQCLIQNNKDIRGMIDLCDLKDTGRGILIVSKLCERMKFNVRGNKVIVMKKL